MIPLCYPGNHVPVSYTHLDVYKRQVENSDDAVVMRVGNMMLIVTLFHGCLLYTSKPIKAKNLPLFSIIDLDQLRREKQLEGTEVTDFFTARDGKVYLLMEQPSETQGKMCIRDSSSSACPARSWRKSR